MNKNYYNVEDIGFVDPLNVQIVEDIRTYKSHE